MKKLTFAIMGMGNRGTAYAAKQLKYPEEMEVVAMADTRRIRLDAANKYLHLPEDRLFDSADALLASALSDKKRSGGTVNLIIPAAIGDCPIVPTPVTELKSFIEAGL